MVKKICFFSTSFAIHKQVRASYAEKFLPENVEIFLLTSKTQNRYDLKRAKVIEISDNKLLFVFMLRKFCIENKIDLLVNLGSPNESFAMMFSTLFSKTKYIIHFCSNIFDIPYGIGSFYEKISLGIKILFLSCPIFLSKRIIFTSEDLRETAKKRFLFSRKKIFFVPLIIDDKLFTSGNKIKAKKELGLPLNKDILLYIGRISYLKGSDILFKLAEMNPDKTFVFIGDIFDKEIINNKSENTILLESQKFRDLIKYYNAADLFIFPSRIEAYGLVPREAMLCEIPSLVSDITALGLTKHVFKSKPIADDMQKQIDLFFSMSNRKKRELGKLSRQYVIETNSYESLKDEWKNILLN